MDRTADLAIVGGGVVGLAHAYFALKKGLKVVLFEREQFAVGASVRNFGLLWPIGQQPEEGLPYALRSRAIWDEIANDAGIWINRNGSLHLAYEQDEMTVLEEFTQLYRDAGFVCRLLTPEQVLALSPGVRRNQLKGGLFSETEATVYSREAIRQLASYLQEKWGLVFCPGHLVQDIALPSITTSGGDWTAKQIIVCSGADFETLYPDVYRKYNFTKCKLQMLKAVPHKPIQLGPSLCAGLTLRHYAAFAKCPTLDQVDKRYDAQEPDFKTHGIHVLVSQNSAGELIIGDSHHYGLTHEPFDSERVNDLILNYLDTFIDVSNLRITERWNGIYPKVKGAIRVIDRPSPGVTIVNGFGGAGMTLSFGVAEEVITSLA